MHPTCHVIAASKYEYEAEAALYLTDNLTLYSAPIPACSSAYTANFWAGAGQSQNQLSDYDAVAAAVTKPEPSSSPLGCPATPESVHSHCSGSEMADSSDAAAANNSSFLLQASSPEMCGSFVQSKGKGGKGKGKCDLRLLGETLALQTGHAPFKFDTMQMKWHSDLSLFGGKFTAEEGGPPHSAMP